MGRKVGAIVGDELGAGDSVGETEGETLGEVVGDSVFKIQRDFTAADNASRSNAWTGRTPRSLAGLLSIIHNAEPLCTLLSSPTPIASRSTFKSSSAFSSDPYCVTAPAFKQLSGPRTQSWYAFLGTQLESLLLQNL